MMKKDCGGIGGVIMGFSTAMGRETVGVSMSKSGQVVGKFKIILPLTWTPTGA